MLQAIQSGYVQSVHDISEGGLAVAVAESMMTTSLGVELSLTGDLVNELFSETQSRFMVSVKSQQSAAFEEMVADAYLIGHVTDHGYLHIHHEAQGTVVNLSHQKMHAAWKEAIPCMMNPQD